MRPTSAPIITPTASGCQVNAAMKVPVAGAAGKDRSPSEAVRDTDAPIKIQTVTRGRCRRVGPIIGCRFATATMSDAARRPAFASGVDRRLSAADGDLAKLGNMNQLRRHTYKDDERHACLGIRIVSLLGAGGDKS
jgi:hypothetical protein